MSFPLNFISTFLHEILTKNKNHFEIIEFNELFKILRTFLEFQKILMKFFSILFCFLIRTIPQLRLFVSCNDDFLKFAFFNIFQEITPICRPDQACGWLFTDPPTNRRGSTRNDK